MGLCVIVVCTLQCSSLSKKVFNVVVSFSIFCSQINGSMLYILQVLVVTDL
jgi:hypothetical protein